MRLLICLLLVASPAAAQLLDGDGSEWPMAVEDSADGGLLSVRAAALSDGLWIGLEFEEEIDADSGSGLVLHLDADADPSTGDRDGCELVYDIRARHGSVHADLELPGDGPLFEKLGIEMAPAFASTSCELFLPRRIRGGLSLFSGPKLRFFVQARNDRVPDEGFVELSWSSGSVPVDPIPVTRHEDTMVRIAAWNIEHDGLFKPERFEAQARILRALQPDVLVVVESFNHDADEVLTQVEPLEMFQYAVKADPGNVVLSRFPILDSWPILSLPSDRHGYRGSAVLLDTPAGPFMVLPQHWRCCAKGEGKRLYEAGAAIGFLRDAFTGGGNFTLESEVPFVVIGDLNLVTTRRPLDVMLSGVVVGKDDFGPDFPPGPQRTSLHAVDLRHNDAPFLYTWHSSGTKYYSARLDWALVPSSIEVLRGFVFDTGTSRGATLDALGVSRRDSRVASDHMPLVVDVAW